MASMERSNLKGHEHMQKKHRDRGATEMLDMNIAPNIGPPKHTQSSREIIIRCKIQQKQ